MLSSTAVADQLRLTDGTTIEVDEAWEDSQGIWYRRGGVTHLLERARVRSIERKGAGDVKESSPSKSAVGGKEPDTKSQGAGGRQADSTLTKNAKPVVRIVENDVAANAPAVEMVLIYLVGGARMEVDEATEATDGVWYRRGNVSIFIERARIERIERERPAEELAAADDPVAAKQKRRERYWTTGSKRLDALIRQNGAAHGVDPYLIFCVMEQESHFNTRATSPVGAQGLMQLMPGTAARFGVRNSHDPAQNVRGGTKYLKQLLRMFNGRVDLVLAGYNAGEGSVRKYGYRVPPYRETRNYVRRISARYGTRHLPATRERTGAME